MAARSPLMTYPVAVKLHPGLSDLQQVGVSSVQRAALAAHGRPGTTQRDPHWRVWTSSSLPSWSPGFSCWSQPRGCSPWQGTPPSRRRLTRSASGIEEIEREALAAYSRLSLVGVRRRGSGDGAESASCRCRCARPAWPVSWRAASTESSCPTSSRAKSVPIYSATPACSGWRDWFASTARAGTAAAGSGTGSR